MQIAAETRTMATDQTTVTATETTLNMQGAKAPTADLPTLTDHLREETMSGSNTYRGPFYNGYLW
ncbi:hypothetical protein GCM10028895_00650 [Pontibacter rugosus]